MAPPPSTSAAATEDDDDVFLPVSPIATMISSRSSKLLWALWGDTNAHVDEQPSLSTIERTRSDVDDMSIPTRWSVRGVLLIVGGLLLPVLAFTFAQAAFFLLEVLWCQWLHVGDIGTARGCELCVWLLTPAIGLVLCALAMPLLQRLRPSWRQRLKPLGRGSLPLLCWCTCVVGMLLIAPVGRVWYRFYDTVRFAPAALNVTDLPEAALAGARQFTLGSGVVASALVSEHTVVKATAHSYFCVAPLVSNDEAALALMDYAHALMPAKSAPGAGGEPVEPSAAGGGSLGARDAASAADDPLPAEPLGVAGAASPPAPASVNVSAWVAYTGAVPCIEPIHETCSTNAFAATHCRPSVPIPDLTRPFTETRIYQSWQDDKSALEALSVRTPGAMVDTAAMFERAVKNSALPSLEGAPVLWWGVDLEGYTQCTLDNALSMLGYWWIGIVVVAACTLYLPQLAGLLAIGFVALAWIGAEFVYDDAHCLFRFLPEASGFEASVSAVS